MVKERLNKGSRLLTATDYDRLKQVNKFMNEEGIDGKYGVDLIDDDSRWV